MDKIILKPYINGQYGIPDYTFSAIKRYVEARIPVGDFLYAVLTNDLGSAIAHADENNKLKLDKIVSFVYNEIPARCWGNKKRVKEWLSGEA